MSKLLFYIVDVFAEHKYEGNQLAVFRGGHHLSTADMQQIAKEMNYSETTFIMSEKPRDGGYDVRIFTPEEEVPFAGHPTLGTAYILAKEIIQSTAEQTVSEVMLNLQVGQIPVNIDRSSNMLWMRQKEPIFGGSFHAVALASMLGISVQQIDQRFPIQEVSTGLPSIIVPLLDLQAVKQCKVNIEQYNEFIERLAAKVILVFSPDTYAAENDLNVRVFCPFYGVTEDPATGSANGNLAGYLTKHRYWGSTAVDICVEQGYEIDRPSLLYLRANTVESRTEIQVGGKVITVAKGEFV